MNKDKKENVSCIDLPENLIVRLFVQMENMLAIYIKFQDKSQFLCILNRKEQELFMNELTTKLSTESFNINLPILILS